MIGEADKYRELVERYREYGNVELLHLAANAGDLTEAAHEALRGEMAARKLSLPTAAPASSWDLDSDSGLPFQYAYRAPANCVTEFKEQEDALAAAEWLRTEGIECDVQLPDAYFEAGCPRVAVAPADAERAAKILAEPIPEEYRILISTRDQFEVPLCPKCKVADPLLEAIEPTNQWLCEACNHTWSDPILSDPALSDPVPE